MNEKYTWNKWNTISFIIVFAVIFLVHFVYGPYADKRIAEIWDIRNNIDPIKNKLNAKIDSVYTIGRCIYFKLDNNDKFMTFARFPDITLPVSKEHRVIIDSLNIGDSVFKVDISDRLFIQSIYGSNWELKLISP